MQNKITKKYPSYQNFFKKRLQGTKTFQQSEERKKKKEKGRRKKEKSKEN